MCDSWLDPGELAGRGVGERHEILRAVLSRRGLLRAGGMAAASATGLSGAVLWAPRATASSSSAVSAVGRWLAFGADPSRQVVVRWQVSAPVTGARVLLGTDTGYGRTTRAELETLRTVLPSGQVTEQHYLRAVLAGLDPRTEYHYRVEHDGSAGQDAAFWTAPAAGDPRRFTFTAFGDQDVTAAARRVDVVLARQRPAFHLLAGDLSYADGTGKGLATDNYRPRRWDRYLAQIDPVASTIPWMIAAGNHEVEAVYGDDGYAGLTTRFTMPGDGPPGCPATWSMVHGRVAVVALDANEVSTEDPANAGYSGGAQTRWAARRLAALRADPAVDFVVVVMHQCAYSSAAGHGSDAGVRQSWTAMFDQHRVDLVISGHNHLYERTDPIRAGRPGRAAPSGETVHPISDGTTYVVVGGGGAGLNAFAAPDRTGAATATDEAALPAHVHASPGDAVQETVAWSRSRYTGWCLLAVDVDPGPPGGTATMTLRTLSADGDLIDTVTLARPARPVLTPVLTPARAALAAGTVAAGALAAGGVAVAVRRARGPSTAP